MGKLVVPSRFRVFGQLVTVTWRKDLYELHKCSGLWEPQGNRISLQIQEKDGLNDEQMYQIYWHEVVHCILDKMDYEKLSKDERLVDGIAQLLHQVLSTTEYGKVKK